MFHSNVLRFPQALLFYEYGISGKGSLRKSSMWDPLPSPGSTQTRLYKGMRKSSIVLRSIFRAPGIYCARPSWWDTRGQVEHCGKHVMEMNVAGQLAYGKWLHLFRSENAFISRKLNVWLVVWIWLMKPCHSVCQTPRRATNLGAGLVVGYYGVLLCWATCLIVPNQNPTFFSLSSTPTLHLNSHVAFLLLGLEVLFMWKWEMSQQNGTMT